MANGMILAIFIVAVAVTGIILGIVYAFSSKAVVVDADVTLNVTKTWVGTEPKDKKTYYLVAGDEVINGTTTSNRRVIEIESPLGMVWTSNPDNDWARIDEGKVYTFKCTGYEIAMTRDNLVCKLA